MVKFMLCGILQLKNGLSLGGLVRISLDREVKVEFQQFVACTPLAIRRLWWPSVGIILIFPPHCLFGAGESGARAAGSGSVARMVIKDTGTELQEPVPLHSWPSSR